MISFRTTGSTKKTEATLRKMARLDISAVLARHGQEGVNALSNATPKDSSLAAQSWGFEITSSGGNYKITWTNSDIENGFPVALMIQLGHGTGTGAYISGIDYINPAMRPIFDRISREVWKAVNS